MSLIRSTALAFAVSALMVLVGAACRVCPAPQPPAAVTPEARWAGDCDGGSWITCTTESAEPFTAFGCKVHDHPAGALRASGPFVLAEATRARGGGTKFRPQSAAFADPPGQFLSYDGTTIALPDGRFLIPHGTIDYPAGDGHGRRVEYRLGEPRLEEAY